MGGLKTPSRLTIRVPVGPQHPALKEPERFIFYVEGEQVVKVIPRIGYNHRGIEKAMEERTYLQDLYISERVCGICSNVHTVCYTLLVERLMNMEIPERAKYIRMIVLELERLHSHLLWLGVAFHEIGFDTLFYLVWRDREIVMDLLELISGNRVNYATNTIGGVRRDISEEAKHKILKGMKILLERLKYYRRLAPEEDTIVKRTLGVGPLSTQDAKRLCAVGPTLRASNVKSDVRGDEPYLLYKEVGFQTMVSDLCDVLGRIIVRIDECIEAVRIIEWCVKNMPEGPIRQKLPPFFKVPESQAYYRVEAPRGELVYYGVSDGTEKPYRIKIRTPTLANIPSLCKMLENQHIADIPIVVASIDPCFSCTDRLVFIDVEKGKKWSCSMPYFRHLVKKKFGR